MYGRMVLNPILHYKNPTFPKNSGSTPTLCLDKFVFAQGEGGGG